MHGEADSTCEAFSSGGFENFQRRKTGSMATDASSRIFATVTPGPTFEIIASRYSGTKPGSARCTGVNLPFTGYMRVMSLV
jgi:hypothetical protein